MGQSLKFSHIMKLTNFEKFTLLAFAAIMAILMLGSCTDTKPGITGTDDDWTGSPVPMSLYAPMWLYDDGFNNDPPFSDCDPKFTQPVSDWSFIIDSTDTTRQRPFSLFFEDTYESSHDHTFVQIYGTPDCICIECKYSHPCH